MEIDTLVLKWQNFENFKLNKGYKALRISNECIPDFYIATDSDGFRCLILYLPHNIDIKLKNNDKEKLKLSYLPVEKIILITLNDPDFIDLFNDLILSLYFKIKDLTDPDYYAKELIYSFYKWADFFDDKFKSRLSNEEIKGLFGELFVLNEFLRQTDSKTVDTILESWKGPYNTTNDFIFDDKNIEVKTKDESKHFIKISSEYQLEKEFDKGLQLLVVSLNIDMIKGVYIYDLIKQATIYIRKNLGDLTILYHTLAQIGLTIESVSEYNNYRFVVSKTILYDCGRANFPKLSVSNIPEEITKLSYNLRVTTLNNFILEEKIY